MAPSSGPLPRGPHRRIARPTEQEGQERFAQTLTLTHVTLLMNITPHAMRGTRGKAKSSSHTNQVFFGDDMQEEGDGVRTFSIPSKQDSHKHCPELQAYMEFVMRVFEGYVIRTRGIYGRGASILDTGSTP